MRNKTPYGYRIVNGLAEPDPIEHEKLLLFYRHYLEGWSLPMCQSAIGIDRSTRGLRGILDNPVYLGTDFYPRLIDRETWEEAKEAAARRGAHLVGTRNDRRLKPVPIWTRFTMETEEGEPADDPIEIAARMYGRIRHCWNEKEHDAPDIASGAFL